MAATPHNISINQKPYVINDIIRATPDVTVFKFKAEDNTTLNFDPGMFVMLTYVDKSNNEKITRAFSIASEPNGQTVDFYIHMVHGKLTSKMESAAIGDRYFMTGPYGQFRFIPDEDKKVMFIAGGTGLAPFMSMLKKIEKESLSTDVVLLYSIRFPSEVIMGDELKEIEKKIHMKTIITVTRPESTDNWDGEKGHINADMIKKYAPDFMERTAYICGPLNFVKAMKESLEALNVPNIKIKADVWG